MIYDYRCPKGHLTEQIRPYPRRMDGAVCKYCGEPAGYTIAAPHLDYYHMGLDPVMSTSADKWANMHEQKARQEQDAID